MNGSNSDNPVGGNPLEPLRRGPHPRQLRSELQEGQTTELCRRRGIIGFSLLGMASMAAVTLLQTGIVKHLPDPPFGNVDSDRVNSSDTAYRFGLPDGPVSLASLALNIPIAASL
jgi:hypothetical protein